MAIEGPLRELGIHDVFQLLVVTERRADAKPPRLPAQVEELKDVVDSQLAKRTLNRHDAPAPCGDG